MRHHKENTRPSPWRGTGTGMFTQCGSDPSDDRAVCSWFSWWVMLSPRQTLWQCLETRLVVIGTWWGRGMPRSSNR